VASATQTHTPQCPSRAKAHWVALPTSAATLTSLGRAHLHCTPLLWF